MGTDIAMVEGTAQPDIQKIVVEPLTAMPRPSRKLLVKPEIRDMSMDSEEHDVNEPMSSRRTVSRRGEA